MAHPNPPRRWGLAVVVVLALSPAPARAATDLRILAPNGGEEWNAGTRQDIRWSGPAGGNVRIELSRDGGLTFQTLFGNVRNDGVQSWEVTGPPSSGCQVRITLLDDPTVSTVSDADFTIVAPSMTVVEPNGGEAWVVGSQQMIAWASAGTGNVRIELSRDGGDFFETVFSNTSDDGAELWTVTGPVSTSCLIRVTRTDDPTVSDLSDGLFAIGATPGVIVDTPNGGELWTVGSRQTIEWHGLGGGKVSIELSRDGGDSWETLFDTTPDDGSQVWTVTGPASTEVVVRVMHVTPPFVADASDGPFTITTDALAVAAPRGGEDWVIGTQQLVQWSSGGLGNVLVELTRDAGTTWETLYDVTPNDGTQFWTVTGPPSGAARVRVTSLDDPSVTGASEAPFAILPGMVAVRAPNGGERLAIGSPTGVSWATTAAGTAHLELTRDDGLTWESLFANTPNDGAETWTVTGPASSACRVRITSWLDASLTDGSDADFAIYCAPTTLTIDPGSEQSGTLGPTDCDAPERPGAKAKSYRFSMDAPGLVSVDVTSAAFDAYAILLGPDGAVIAENDNGGGATDARIDSIDLPAGGPYVIEVTSAAPGGVGDYRVTLSRFDVTLTGPTGGSVWQLGENRLIAWRSAAPGVPVEITLFRQGPGGPGEVLAMATANDGTEPWIVSPPASTAAVFQVCIPYGSRGTKICDAGGPVVIEPCTLGAVRPCYDGPVGTLGLGQCKAGRQVCSNDGILGVCTGTVLPAAELCGDGVDQDCNGADTRCPPCPKTGDCKDDDPCAVDTCVTGVCRQQRPAGWALFECRGAVLSQALAVMDGTCPDNPPAALRKRYQQRIGRLFAVVEKLAARARATRNAGKCVARLARARQRTLRLGDLIAAARAKGILCDADPTVLDQRVGEVGAAIVSVSSCQPQP